MNRPQQQTAAAVQTLAQYCQAAPSIAVFLVLALGLSLHASARARADQAPDGRVYEKITPNDKNGGDATLGAILDNDHIAVTATAAFLADDPFFAGGSIYNAARSGSGWALQPAFVGAHTQVSDVNAANTQQVISCDFGLCPSLLGEDTDASADIYARDASGLRLVSKGSEGANSGAAASYGGQSRDGSHIFFETTEHLEPADDPSDAGTVQLYERVAGQTRVVGVLPDGTVDPGGAVLGNGANNFLGVGAGSSNAISADGSTVFFESPDPNAGGDHQLYMRTNASHTVKVSASQCDPACDGSPAPATFQGASDDGSIVYFTSAAQLVNSDTDDTTDLYRYQLATGKLTLISNSCTTADATTVDCGFPNGVGNNGDEGVIDVSDDGRRVYFESPPIPDGDFAGTPVSSIWLYDQGTATTTFVAPIGGTAPGLRSAGLTHPSIAARMTPDGATLLFFSELKLTAFDNVSAQSCSQPLSVPPFFEPVPCVELYRYTVQTGVIDCISCNPFGVAPVGNTAPRNTLLAAQSLSPIAGAQHPNQLISDDGQIIAFQTSDALVPKDTNGKLDAYVWENGTVSLLTSGTAATNGDFVMMGVTHDGNDVFFATFDRLVASDVDFQADLYDARIGGSPESDTHVIPCEGDACHGPQAATPANDAPASATQIGPGNVRTQPRAKPKTCKKGYVRKFRNQKRVCVKRRATKAAAKHTKKTTSHRRTRVVTR